MKFYIKVKRTLITESVIIGSYRHYSGF